MEFVGSKAPEFFVHVIFSRLGHPTAQTIGGMGHRGSEREEEARPNHCSVKLRRHAGHRRVPMSRAAARVPMR